MSRPTYTPQRGCSVWEWPVGNNCVIPIEYEVERAEKPVFDVNSPLCGPGRAESVTLLNAFVNGEWLDCQDVFGREKCEYLLERINEAREGEAGAEQIAFLAYEFADAAMQELAK